MAQIVSIRPDRGEYCVAEFGRACPDADKLIEIIRSLAAAKGDQVYELGFEELPEGVDDIRGRIHGEPPRVFVRVDPDGLPNYFGVVDCARKAEGVPELRTSLPFDVALRKFVTEAQALVDAERARLYPHNRRAVLEISGGPGMYGSP